MQKTDFDYEILIHDDASTDNTAKIIKEYYEKYPKIIKPILRAENIKSKIGGGVNVKFNMGRAQGKYIALCDGDDYWTDPLKLQKQVDFLEGHEEYSLSHTNCDIYLEKQKKLKEKINIHNKNVELNTKAEVFYAILSSELIIRTPTVVFRSIYLRNVVFKSEFLRGDIPLFLTLSQMGRIHYLNESTAAYRFSPDTASRPKAIKNKLKFQLTGYLTRFYYCNKYNYKIPNEIVNKYQKTLLDYSLLGKNKKYVDYKYLSEKTKCKIDTIYKRNCLVNKLIYFYKYPRKVLGYKRQNLFKF